MKTILTSEIIIKQIVRKVATDLGCSSAVASLLAENYVIDKPIWFHKWLSSNCVRCIHDPSYCNFWNPDESNLSTSEFESWRVHNVLKDVLAPCPEKELAPVNTNSDT